MRDERRDVEAAMFLDRVDAGKQLAEAVISYKGKPVVVYALPRGGVVLGVGSRLGRAFGPYCR
jgi:predicted phosphoribosyltransferase